MPKEATGQWKIADVCAEKFRQFDCFRNSLLMVGLALMGIVYNIYTSQIENAKINGRITQIVDSLAEVSQEQGKKINELEKDITKLSARL